MLVDHAESIGWCNGNGQPSVGQQMNRSHNYLSSDNNEFPALMHINSEHCATALRDARNWEGRIWTFAQSVLECRATYEGTAKSCSPVSVYFFSLFFEVLR
jgi:hypothetical protein